MRDSPGLSGISGIPRDRRALVSFAVAPCLSLPHIMARSSPKRRAPCTAPWSGEVARACKVTRAAQESRTPAGSCAGERSAVPPSPIPGPLRPQGRRGRKGWRRLRPPSAFGGGGTGGGGFGRPASPASTYRRPGSPVRPGAHPLLTPNTGRYPGVVLVLTPQPLPTLTIFAPHKRPSLCSSNKSLRPNAQ